jgi:hypothetical protein
MPEPKKKNIIESMVAITRDIGAIQKDQKAPEAMGGYRFRGIDQVLFALQPQLVTHGVALQVKVLDVGAEVIEQRSGSAILTTAKVKYTFHAPDGSFIEHVIAGQGMDRADKGVAKALSTAFKSMCFQVFCIPTDESVDTERDSHEEPAPVSHAAQRAEAQQQRAPVEQQAPRDDIKPNPDGITEKMAYRAMMIGKDRAEADGCKPGESSAWLNHCLNAEGMDAVTGQMTMNNIKQQLIDIVPSNRNKEGAYDSFCTRLKDGPAVGEPEPIPAPVDNDDIPF